jgi:hypothetical protein
MKIQEKAMNILFVWNLPQSPPRTPAEEDAYYAQFELWPGHAGLSAARRGLQRIFQDRRVSPKRDLCSDTLHDGCCSPATFSVRMK